MKEKKTIDKLFKEQLKDFEATPSDAVWEQIEKELHQDERKKRRVIPIWWKFAGIAAGLALIFTIANLMLNSSDNENHPTNIIVDDANTKQNNPKNGNLDLENQNSNNLSSENNDLQSVANSANDDLEDNQATKDKNNQNSLTNNDNSEDQIVATNPNTKLQGDDNKTPNYSTNNAKDESYDSAQKLTKNPKTSGSNAVAQSNKNSSSSNTKSENGAILKSPTEMDALIQNTKDSKTAVTNNHSEKDTTDINNPKPDSQSTTDDNQQDSITEDSNAIENAIAEAENTNEKEKEEEKLNRWSVSPNVAPVYFSSLGEGSSIDDQFVKNNKQAEINMSYGVSGSYAINKKLKIRAGINRVNLGQTTNDVLIFENNSGPVARTSSPLSNINMVQGVGSHSVYSVNNFKFDSAPTSLFTLEHGSIDQQLGFIEVPIEIEYGLIERKLGVNLIGGFSTLFLNNNDVYAVFNSGERARLGDASNVRDVSYSANFGVGLDYNFSKQWQFNLEPTFKYQINTFNNASGNFQPFFIGVYTGLSYKF
ncbi:hypothetical protein AB9K26_11355 [Psychroserpens sp. XS_ASV72]|uniref:hypothetical protein n=1 Tax=Psychroserpens sp. XS_ASV72 TaxID=3241293 RepID=UPI0035144391